MRICLEAPAIMRLYYNRLPNETAERLAAEHFIRATMCNIHAIAQKKRVLENSKDFVHIVRHVDHGYASILSQIVDNRKQMFPAADIESVAWFIKNQQLWLAHERTSKHNVLPFALAERSERAVYLIPMFSSPSRRFALTISASFTSPRTPRVPNSPDNTMSSTDSRVYILS